MPVNATTTTARRRRSSTRSDRSWRCFRSRSCEERIVLLNEEIARLQAAIASKQGSRSVADQFFKK